VKEQMAAIVTAERAEGVREQDRAPLRDLALAWYNEEVTDEETEDILYDQYGMTEVHISRFWLLLALALQQSKDAATTSELRAAVSAFLGQRREGGYYVAMRYDEDEELDGVTVAVDYWHMDRRISSATPIQWVRAAHGRDAAENYLAARDSVAAVVEVAVYDGRTVKLHDWDRVSGVKPVKSVLIDPAYKQPGIPTFLQLMECSVWVCAMPDDNSADAWDRAVRLLLARIKTHCASCDVCD